MRSSTILLLLLAMVCGCGEAGDRVPSADAAAPNPALLGPWVHAHEQDAKHVQVWVRPGARLPRSMFRESITLEEGAEAKVLCPAADDAHKVFDGTWRVDSKGALDIEVSCFGRSQPMHFIVVEVTEGVLRLKAVE